MSEQAWLPIDTAPVGKRVLIAFSNRGHRLVIGLLSKDGIWLDEGLRPLPLHPFRWHPLPEFP